MVVNRNPEYFLTIARERNISRAAEKLFVSQSSLGQYLAKTYLETKRRPIYLLAETDEGRTHGGQSEKTQAD